MNSSLNDFQAGVKASEEGRYQDAVKHFEAAIAAKPEEAAFFNLGSAYFRLKNYEAARRNLISALKINQRLTRAHILLGYIYGHDKNFEKAAIYFKNALTVEKNSRPAVTGLALSLSESGKYEEALKVITSFPGNESDVTLAGLKAGLHLKLGHLKESAKEYVMLTKSDPRYKSFSDHLAAARESEDADASALFEHIEDKIKDRTAKVKELLTKKKSSPDTVPTQEDLKDMVDLSFLHLFNGDPEKAVKLLLEAKRIKDS